MFSHVSNAEVRDRANQQCLSQHLLAKQLLYFGKVAAMPDTALPRQSIFQSGGVQLIDPGRRRRGRPRLQWASVMRAHAVQAAVSAHPGAVDPEAAARNLLGPTTYNARMWRTAVYKYCC